MKQAYSKAAELKMRQMERTIRDQNDKLGKMEAVIREIERSKLAFEVKVQQQVIKQVS